MTEVDLSTWLTKPQAADAIGVSTKAIERFTQAGKLERRMRPQARGPQVAVYFPDDVAKLAAERQSAPSPFVVPAVPDGNGTRTLNPHRIPPTAGALTVDVAAPSDDLFRALFGAALRAVLSQTSETPAPVATSFITLRQAAAVTGLSQAYLRRLIDNLKLPAIRDRGWRIRRRDLEQL